MRRRTPLRRTGGPRRTSPLRARRVRPTVAGRPRTPPGIPRALRDLVAERDEYRCVYCGRHKAPAVPFSTHHRAPRGMGGSPAANTAANVILLCGTGTTGCHGLMESNRAWATSLGYLVPSGINPLAWRVYRPVLGWSQPTATGWLPADPAPGQTLLPRPDGTRP